MKSIAIKLCNRSTQTVLSGIVPQKGLISFHRLTARVTFSQLRTRESIKKEEIFVNVFAHEFTKDLFAL